jgi:hypothetical protein
VGAGLGPTQRAALSVIAEHWQDKRYTTMTEIADALAVTIRRAGSIADSLEVRGLAHTVLRGWTGDESVESGDVYVGLGTDPWRSGAEHRHPPRLEPETIVLASRLSTAPATGRKHGRGH